MKHVQHIKRWLVLLWLLVPVALVSYHFGPGQRALAWREAAARRDKARAAEEQGHWEQAIEAYSEALNVAPSADDASAAGVARDQLRLAQILAAFQLGKLNNTLTDLEQFVERVEATHGTRSQLAYDARDLLGRVHYQAMISLRLEQAKEQVWMKHWELSRQNFRFLAENSSTGRNGLDRKNLELVIKSANLPHPPSPGGGAGGGGGAAPPMFTPPPPTPPTAGAAPSDNRFRAPTLNSSEAPPPEFKLGS